MILEYDIRKKLIKLLTGDVDLDTFESWIVRNSWNMHRDSSKDSQALVTAVELSLAEFSNAHISEEMLRSRFKSLVNNSAQRGRDTLTSGDSGEMPRTEADDPEAHSLGVSAAKDRSPANQIPQARSTRADCRLQHRPNDRPITVP